MEGLYAPRHQHDQLWPDAAARPRRQVRCGLNGNLHERTSSNIIAFPASHPPFVNRGVGDTEDHGPRHGSKAPGKGCHHPRRGEPDFDTPAHIKDAAARAMHAGATKYTALDGTPDLKSAIREAVLLRGPDRHCPQPQHHLEGGLRPQSQSWSRD